jgi:hypothetical protein
MYSAFIGAVAPGQDGMHCALVPISNAALKGFFRLRVFRAPGSTVVPTDRLRLHYPESHTFTIREVQQGRVEVTITLPLQLRSNPQKSYQTMEHNSYLDTGR